MGGELLMIPELFTRGWSEWTGTTLEWNQVIESFSDESIYQTTNWALHKSTSGWNVVRFVHSNDGVKVDTAAQCLYRYGPLKTAVVWIPGGPIGNIKSVDTNFVTQLKMSLSVTFLYIRISIMRGISPDTTTHLTLNCWRKSQSTISTKSSLIHLLDMDQSSRLIRCSSNWKRNLKRSSRNPLSPYIWKDVNATSLSAAYSEMDSFKKIEGVVLARPINELQSVIDIFKEDLILVRSDDINGNPLAIRGVLCFHKTAWDFIALTTPLGRKCYASHAVFWMLADECYQRGILQYDLGGIDPINNRGVYDFKKGTGALQVDYQGEWEISSHRLFGILASRLISRRVA